MNSVTNKKKQNILSATAVVPNKQRSKSENIADLSRAVSFDTTVHKMFQTIHTRTTVDQRSRNSSQKHNYIVPTTGLHTRPTFCKRDLVPPSTPVLTLSLMTVFK